MSLESLLELVPYLALLLGATGVVIAILGLRRANDAHRKSPYARSNPVPLARPAAEPPLRVELYALGDEVKRLARELEQMRALVESLASRFEEPSVERVAAPAPAGGDPFWTPPETPRGRPVEFDGESLRLSRSLSALGSLVVGHELDGGATLYLNEQIEIDHVALERWSRFFDFRGGQAYARYRTVQPARVQWNEEAGRGQPLARGVAEVAL